MAKLLSQITGSGLPDPKGFSLETDSTVFTLSQSINVLSSSVSIVPTSNDLDLGSSTKPWKDLYLSSASLYVDGTQVLSSDASTITISTDENQSLKIVETGNDNITLESTNGNIILNTTGTGVVELSSGLELTSGSKISSDDSSNIQFANGVGITGSLDVSENILVKGTLTAQEFNTEFVSSSIIFESGSTKFGDSSDDSHDFTGSLNLSGSMTVGGDILPDTNEAYDLGSPTNRFRDLYLSGSSVFLGDTKLSRDTNGDLEVRDRGTDNLKRIRVDEIEIGSGANARRIKQSNGRIQFVDNTDTDLGGDALGVSGLVSSSAQLDNTSISNLNLTDNTVLSGSFIITGSVFGNTTDVTVSSDTASIDLSKGSFFTITLTSGTTHFEILNSEAGMTANILVSTTTNCTASFSSNVKQVSGSLYSPTDASSKDVLTFVSFDNSDVYLSNVTNLI